MQKKLTPAERLIVAADFKPPPEQLDGECATARDWVGGQVLHLADSLQGTGVCIKVNSALRTCGYSLIGLLHQREVRVFADLKLTDIGETLSTDGMFLREARPYLLTTMCAVGAPALRVLKAELPDTEVLGVTVLTSLKEDDTQKMFGCSVAEAVMRFAQTAVDGNLDGLISSPKEAEMIRAKFGTALSLNTPAIRPAWAVVPGDDQNLKRVMTPADAIKAGADRIVVGRPIIQAKNPRDAVMRTIDEIASAMA